MFDRRTFLGFSAVSRFAGCRSLTATAERMTAPDLDGVAHAVELRSRFRIRNLCLVKDGRVFFTFSVRAYGSYLGVMSFDPDKRDFRLEGVILFDYGDGLLRNDIAADLFYDDVAEEWRAYVSNFSTSGDALKGRAKGGINCAWSKVCPLFGVSVLAGLCRIARRQEDPPDVRSRQFPRDADPELDIWRTVSLFSCCPRQLISCAGWMSSYPFLHC